MTRSYGIIVCRRMLIIVCLVHFWDQLLRVSSKCPVLIEGCAVLLFYAPRQNKWGASNLKKSEQANESQNDSNTKCILDKKDIDADGCVSWQRGHL